MAKNKVQFQQGIFIHDFMYKYGIEEQCQKRLFEMRLPTGYRCPNCNHDRYCHLQSRALFQCNLWHHQALLISGTLFAYSKLPLTVWFLNIYLITQEKTVLKMPKAFTMRLSLAVELVVWSCLILNGSTP